MHEEFDPAQVIDPDSGQIYAWAYQPDGTPVPATGVVTPAGGRPPPGTPPFRRIGRDEARAIANAKRAWWHPKRGRPGCHDVEGADLVGATIRIGGEIVERYDQLPVYRCKVKDSKERGVLHESNLRCTVRFDGAIGAVGQLVDGHWKWRPAGPNDWPLVADTSAAVAVRYDWVDARAEAVAAREAAELEALNARLKSKPKKEGA